MLGRFTFIVLAALLAGTAVNAPAAPSLVTGLSLTHEGDYTVVSIQGDGPVRVSHQSVIAKEGKPFRIVVDCLAARHGLTQKEFASLPSSIVTALRTSQYAVKPEEIVRVVIDLAREVVYRVETSGSVAKIFVSDPQTAAFAAWSSPAAANKGTTVAMTPAKTVVASTTPSPAGTTPTAKPAASIKTPSIVAQKSADQATSKTPSAATATQAPAYAAQPTTSGEPAAKTATGATVVKTPTSSAPAMAAKTPSTPEKAPAGPSTGKDLPPAVMADLAKKTNDVAWLFGAAEENSSAVLTPGDDPGAPAEDVHKAAIGTALKPSTADNPSTPQKDVPAVKPAVDETDKALASIEPATVPVPSPADEDSAIDDVSSADLLPAVDQASKYRRDAARNTVLKQTHVVEFPKRFVTTYEPGDERDPFETLIDETKPNRGSLENRIANVDALLLVGLLESETGKTAALLEDLDGIGYILKPGDPVKNGYVTQIDDKAVYFQINEYGWSRTIVKELDRQNSTKQ